jgi:hypothetical protein
MGIPSILSPLHPSLSMAQSVGESMGSMADGSEFQRSYITYIPLSLSWPPPASISDTQKTAPSSHRQGNRIMVESWDMMAMGELAPKLAPLFKPMPFSTEEFSASRLRLHTTSQWVLQSKPDRIQSRCTHGSHLCLPAAACGSVLIDGHTQGRACLSLFKDNLSLSWEWKGKVSKEQTSLMAYSALHKHFLWSQSLPREAGMMSHVPNCKFKYKVK